MQEGGRVSMPGLCVVSGDLWGTKTREGLVGPGGDRGHQLIGLECGPGRGARRVYWRDLIPRRE